MDCNTIILSLKILYLFTSPKAKYERVTGKGAHVYSTVYKYCHVHNGYAAEVLLLDILHVQDNLLWLIKNLKARRV